MKESYHLFSKDNSLESVKIVKACSSSSNGDLLSHGGFIPLLLKTEIINSLSEISESSISEDVNLEFSQSNSLKRNQLSFNASSGSFNENLKL